MKHMFSFGRQLNVILEQSETFISFYRINILRDLENYVSEWSEIKLGIMRRSVVEQHQMFVYSPLLRQTSR